MNRFVSGLLIAASVFAVSGFTALPSPASSNAGSVPFRSTLSSNAGDQARVDLLDADVASQRGDWNLSADLAEKSYRAKPDLINEFNLATAYQHTHRGALAVPLYVDLVDRGQYTRTAPIYSYDGRWPAPMLPFIADEAAHRLNQMGVPTTLEAPASMLVAR